MYISQAIFTTSKEAADTLRTIMTTKLISSRKAAGCISSELWVTFCDKEAGYCLLSKWENKECFQDWMREAHSSKGKQAMKKPENMPLAKILYQFEETHL